MILQGPRTGEIFRYANADVYMAASKNLEKGDRILDVREVGVQTNSGAEAFPLGPVGTVLRSMTGRDPGSHLP